MRKQAGRTPEILKKSHAHSSSKDYTKSKRTKEKRDLRKDLRHLKEK